MTFLRTGGRIEEAAPDLYDGWRYLRLRLVSTVRKLDDMRSGHGIHSIPGISSQHIYGACPGYVEDLNGNGQVRFQCLPETPKLYKRFLDKVLAEAGGPGVFEEIEIKFLVIGITYLLKALFRAILQINDQSSIHFIPGQ